jgi:hypothetical protein
MWMACTSLLSALVMACSSDKDSTIVESADLPSFNDLGDAPAEIQTAARAVVRLHTAWAYGTGSFISSTGLLLTNNHVLGDTVCPVEGCFLEISQLYQRGQPRVDPSTVFAVPVAVDVGLDMATVQLYQQPGGAMLSTSDYLSFDPQEAGALLGEHVTIVGHPLGDLKKWTDGFVVDATGKWFTSTAYTLPGNSGSAVLNDAGQIVGLLHRGPVSQDLFTDNGVNIYSVGTGSAPIAAAMNAPLPNTMLSNVAPTTTAQFLANDFVYLNSRIATVTADSVSASAVSLLGQACDSALARNDFQSIDDMYIALAPCYDAQAWIECRTDAYQEPYGVVCPAAQEVSAWHDRYQSVSRLWVTMNGTVDYYTVSSAVARLYGSVSLGATAARDSLLQAIGDVNPVLDYELAYYLAAFAIDSYDGIVIKDYITNYRQVLHYELQADYIAYAATWLYAHHSMSKTDLVAFLKQLMSDPKSSVGTELDIEAALYELDAL